jgi:exodeoxyribonuclease VIII
MITGPLIPHGIHHDLPEDQYHAAYGVGSSDLRRLLSSSPAHLYCDQQEGKKDPTPAMVFGSLFHMAVLQPQRVICVPEDAPKRPSAIQRNAKKPSPETLEAIRFWDDFEARAQGKIVADPEDLQRVQRMQEAIQGHQTARAALGEGRSEVSVFWQDGPTGETCKVRLDRLPDGGTAIVDIKTCMDARRDAFMAHAFDFGYHIQAAYYLDIATLAGLEVTDFVILAVEKDAPHAVSVFRLSERAIEAGRAQYRKALAIYSACRQSEVWPAYGDGIEVLDLPAWAARKLEEAV